MFSTLHKSNFKFSVTFILPSANAFDLDKPKILSFVNETGEIARYEQFLLFPQCFQRFNTADTHKRGLFGDRVIKGSKISRIFLENCWTQCKTVWIPDQIKCSSLILICSVLNSLKLSAASRISLLF